MPAFFPILETLLKRFDFSFISSIVAKRFPFIGVFSFEKRKMSAVAKPGEYRGWGMITVLFLNIDVWPSGSPFILEWDSMSKISHHCIQYKNSIIIFTERVIVNKVAVVGRLIRWKARFRMPGQASKRNVKEYISSTICSQRISAETLRVNKLAMKKFLKSLSSAVNVKL